MKKSIIVAAIGLLALPASAQQQQKSPSQAAVDICNEVGLISRWADQQDRIIAQQQAEIEKLKKQIEAAKPPEPKQ